MRTNWPGSRRLSLFGNSARNWRVPSIGSMVLAMKFNLPLTGNTLPSGKTSSTPVTVSGVRRPPGRRAASLVEMLKRTHIGSFWYTEVNRLSDPTVIRFPIDFAARPEMPSTGAVTVVHERFNWAWRNAACASSLALIASSYSLRLTP